jgi:hypothetical protein
VAAEPAALMAALNRYRGLSLSGQVYALARHRVSGRSSRDRAAYLELAARTVGALPMADELMKRFPDRPWSAR